MSKPVDTSPNESQLITPSFINDTLKINFKKQRNSYENGSIYDIRSSMQSEKINPNYSPPRILMVPTKQFIPKLGNFRAQ